MKLVKTMAASAILLFACQSTGFAATTKSDYEAVKTRADTDYRTASDACKGMSGNAKDVCVAEAKAARTRATAMAEADYKNTPKARASARNDVADADYDVAKQRCDAKTGNDKDVCSKEAKAAMVSAKADAKANQKSAVARNDAAEDKRDANYKVAVEKCDALAGAPKDRCQADAKATFHK